MYEISQLSLSYKCFLSPNGQCFTDNLVRTAFVQFRHRFYQHGHIGADILYTLTLQLPRLFSNLQRHSHCQSLVSEKKNFSVHVLFQSVVDSWYELLMPLMGLIHKHVGYVMPLIGFIHKNVGYVMVFIAAFVDGVRTPCRTSFMLSVFDWDIRQRWKGKDVSLDCFHFPKHFFFTHHRRGSVLLIVRWVFVFLFFSLHESWNQMFVSCKHSTLSQFRLLWHTHWSWVQSLSLSFTQHHV